MPRLGCRGSGAGNPRSLHPKPVGAVREFGRILDHQQQLRLRAEALPVDKPPRFASLPKSRVEVELFWWIFDAQDPIPEFGSQFADGAPTVRQVPVGPHTRAVTGRMVDIVSPVQCELKS